MDSYLRTVLGGWRSYHNQKEAMAYAAAAISVGTFLGGAFKMPTESDFSLVELRVGSIVLAVLVHRFIRWQLELRRRAAHQVVGTETILAKWTLSPPVGSHVTWIPDEVGKRKKAWEWTKARADHWLFPVPRDLISAHHLAQSLPKDVVDAWLAAQRSDRRVLLHELIVSALYWFAFAAFLVALHRSQTCLEGTAFVC